MKLERAVIEVAGGCNYTCQMCPQTTGRGKDWTPLMPLADFKDTLSQITPKYGHPVINLEGSGEPLLAKNIHEYVQAVTDVSCPSFMYTNGSLLTGEKMRRVVDAGIKFIRISFIGYNAPTYKSWMGIDNFNFVKENVIELNEYINEVGSDCEVSTYHLILNDRQVEFEVEEYRRNVVSPLGVKGYIWKMHNWSGNYDPSYERNPSMRRSCGRPNSPEITVRAGGINGSRGAVTPCCQTMGPPNEEKSVLGHFSEQTFEEIYWGEKYQALREAHNNKDFDSIEYCKNCDFLYDDPEVLVWSNAPDSSVDHMLGTNFSLADFR